MASDHILSGGSEKEEVRAGRKIAIKKLKQGGHMSKDNLILFPKKSKSIDMSISESEVKWMISGSLLVVLCLAIGINSTLFAPSTQLASPVSEGRSIASINPIFKISWEKKAFEVLQSSDTRDLAHVGKKPSAFDEFAFGSLGGKYSIRMEEGQIAEIQFAQTQDAKPKYIRDREKFLNSHLAFFSKEAKEAQKVFQETRDGQIVERFQLKSAEGQDLGVVQLLLDQNNNLISMTAQ